MRTGYTAAGGIAITLAGLLLTACMDQPPSPRHPGPYEKPSDAFNATTAPTDPGGQRGGARPLTDDMAHLRDARSTYRHSQTMQKSRQRHEQEACRHDPDRHLVRIEDGTDDPEAVYCQDKPREAKDEDKGDDDK